MIMIQYCQIDSFMNHDSNDLDKANPIFLANALRPHMTLEVLEAIQCVLKTWVSL